MPKPLSCRVGALDPTIAVFTQPTTPIATDGAGSVGLLLIRELAAPSMVIFARRPRSVFKPPETHSCLIFALCRECVFSG